MKLIFAFVVISIVLIFGLIVFERRSEKLEANRKYIVTNVGWIAQALEDESNELKSIKIKERAVMKWLFNGAIIEIDRWIINTTENGLPY